MFRTFFVIAFAFVLLIPSEHAFTMLTQPFEGARTISVPHTPSAPDTALETPPERVLIGESAYEERRPHPSEYPARLVMPSIRLDTSVTKVGITANGEMDVPDGNTMDVGWYKYGSIPGEIGSAVMDAHVYAAFQKLRYLKVGSDIYVVNKKGEKMHFRVTDSRVYTLEEIPLEDIFNNQNGRHLNFITCARKFIPSLNTYSHRLVVYTERVYD